MIGDLAIACSLALAVLTLADIRLILFHLQRGKHMLAREHHDLAQSLDHAQPTPSVCVQLPVHNEAALVSRAIDALCSLDWPQDQLEVLVLDDASTDATLHIATERAAIWKAKGLRIRVHHRRERRGYKAGLLAEGLEKTEAPYVAVFDVDYWPSPEVLRQLMGVMSAGPHLSFVQARLGYRNRDRNWLTRAQATELDTLLAYEHATRNWLGVPIGFNGTCAVWRRRAIEEAGGWSDRSLVEDQDLSFRAFARGWPCRFLTTVVVPGELPQSLSVLSAQRLRWGAGTAQQLRVFQSDLVRHLSVSNAALFVVLSLFHTMVRPLVALAAVLLAAACIWEPERSGMVAVFFGLALLMIVGTKSIGALLALRTTCRESIGRAAMDILEMWLLQICLVPVGVQAFVHGLFRSGGEFVRTPKSGAEF